MPNMLDYIRHYGATTFEELPFTPVDNLILCQFAYSVPIDADGGRNLCEVAARMSPIPLEKLLINSMAAASRYARVIPVRYIDHTDPDAGKQFAAVSFLLPDDTIYVAFRGTDGTLVGWKEDFNLSFATPVPAQIAAVEYLNSIAREFPGRLRVGGHSKGGNLAVYAAAMCDEAVQKSIMEVYSNDGPGLDEKTTVTEGYLRVKDRIRAYIPQSSIIGMLLEHTLEYSIVRSSAVGLTQHWPYTWQVSGSDFDYVSRRTRSSVQLDSVISRWIASMPTDERRDFTDALFELLSAGGTTTLAELMFNWKSAPERMRELKQLAPRDWPMLMRVFAKFMQAASVQYKQGTAQKFAGLSDSLSALTQIAGAYSVEKIEMLEKIKALWLQKSEP